MSVIKIVSTSVDTLTQVNAIMNKFKELEFDVLCGSHTFDGKSLVSSINALKQDESIVHIIGEDSAIEEFYNELSSKKIEYQIQ